jgi:hypothetical protein
MPLRATSSALRRRGGFLLPTITIAEYKITRSLVIPSLAFYYGRLQQNPGLSVGALLWLGFNGYQNFNRDLYKPTVIIVATKVVRV